MCSRKSCACYRNWKSSLHGSRWLILIKLLKIIGYRLPELSIYKGRLKRKKAACTICFPCRTLNSSRYPVLSPRGREPERGQQAARLVFGRLGIWERLPQFGECPLPSPPPQGREQIAAGFTVTGGLKSNLNLQPLIAGRLKSKKQPAQPIFLAKPLIPTASPSSLSWERARESNKPQGLYFGGWVVGKGCRNSENALSPALPHGGGGGLQQIQVLQVVWKRMPETSTAGIFQAAFIARQMEQTPQSFSDNPQR